MADLCFVFASSAEKDAEGVIGKYFWQKRKNT